MEKQPLFHNQKHSGHWLCWITGTETKVSTEDCDTTAAALQGSHVQLSGRVLFSYMQILKYAPFWKKKIFELLRVSQLSFPLHLTDMCFKGQIKLWHLKPKLQNLTIKILILTVKNLYFLAKAEGRGSLFCDVFRIMLLKVIKL